MSALTILTSFLSLFFSFNAVLAAPTDVIDFKDDVVWGFDFIDDKTIVATLRAGKMYLVNSKTKKKSLLNAPEVYARGQGGLLDVKVKPINGKTYLYITYSKKVKGGSTTALARAEYKSGKQLKWKDLFVAQAVSSKTRHYGSRLLFINDHIYMTVGDRAEREKSQNLDVHNGKVLRLTLEGKAASGNPFERRKDALPEIWSYGHRNPQGISYDPDSKIVYAAEFGPRGGDEVNQVEPGKNYGWPVITHGRNYIGTRIGPSSKEGMEQPFVQWTPSISPSGMAFYKDSDGKKSLLLGCLASAHLRKVELNGKRLGRQSELLKDYARRLRQVRIGPQNKIYISTDSGKIVRL